MRAKATEQVDDLAQSFVMEAKEESDYHSNDYDTWPMGEEEKNPMELHPGSQFFFSQKVQFFMKGACTLFCLRAKNLH